MNAVKPLTRPYVHQAPSTRSVMADVLIALLPVVIWSVYIYGARAAFLLCIGVGSALLCELYVCLLTRRPITALDGSAALTGLLCVLCMPVTVPLWMPALASFIAIVPLKALFGGLGRNYLNPAAGAICLLEVLFRDAMRVVPPASTGYDPLLIAPALPESVSILETLKQGHLPNVSYTELLIGDRSGLLGELSALLLIGGGLYLILRGVISWHIPAFSLLSFAVLANFFPLHDNAMKFMLLELLGGSLLLGAFFMATDPVTSPMTSTAKIAYGVGIGALTYLFRRCGFLPEGVFFAIVCMNLAARPLEALTRPKPFGHLRENAAS